MVLRRRTLEMPDPEYLQVIWLVEALGIFTDGCNLRYYKGSCIASLRMLEKSITFGSGSQLSSEASSNCKTPLMIWCAQI